MHLAAEAMLTRKAGELEEKGPLVNLEVRYFETFGDDEVLKVVDDKILAELPTDDTYA